MTDEKFEEFMAKAKNWTNALTGAKKELDLARHEVALILVDVRDQTEDADRRKRIEDLAGELSYCLEDRPVDEHGYTPEDYGGMLDE